MEADSDTQNVESASVSLVDGMHFAGDIDGFRVDLDAAESVGGRDAGTEPLRLLLLGMAGCTAMDVISILRKKRQHVSGLEVEVRGSRADVHPRVYDGIEIIYRVRGKEVNSQALNRAIELSETRYCPAIAMISEVAEVTSRYEIEEEG